MKKTTNKEDARCAGNASPFSQNLGSYNQREAGWGYGIFMPHSEQTHLPDLAGFHLPILDSILRHDIAAEQRRSGIVGKDIFMKRGGGVVGIAIFAAVAAGVVHPDIHAGHAAAFLPLIFVLGQRERYACDLFK